MGDVLQFAGVLATVLGVPVLVFYVLLPLAKRIGGGSASADPAMLAELEQLRDDVDALRDVVSRVPELEERVDFAERLLARQSEPARLGGEREGGAP